MRLVDADALTLMDVHLIDGVLVCDAPTVCDIEQIRAEIEEMKDGFIDNTKLLNVVLEIIDKHMKGEQDD